MCVAEQAFKEEDKKCTKIMPTAEAWRRCEGTGQGFHILRPTKPADLKCNVEAKTGKSVFAQNKKRDPDDM